MKQQRIIRLASLTLFGMGGLGVLIMVFLREESMYDIFNLNEWYLQIGLGLPIGLIIGVVGWWIVSLPYLSKTKKFFSSLVSNFGFSWWQILYVSFCAGVGEELLFRGAIQPWLGVWLTSILFVTAHGYLNPKNLPISAYGVFMVFSIAIIGFLNTQYGLISAISAHFMIDVYLFKRLSS